MSSRRVHGPTRLIGRRRRRVCVSNRVLITRGIHTWEVYISGPIERDTPYIPRCLKGRCRVRIPNRVLVRIVGKSHRGVDAVVG